MTLERFTELENLGEFEQVVQRANRKLAAESVVELVVEVSESIKFELGQLSWRQFLPEPDVQISLQADHNELEVISGTLTYVGSEYLCISSSANSYLVAMSKVLWVSGLQSKPTRKPVTTFSDFELRILLQTIQEQAISASFFIGRDVKVCGLISAIYRDAIAIVTPGQQQKMSESLPKVICNSQIVAVRYSS